MRVYKTIAAFRAARRKLTGTLGFVPTMGYLHEGHMELVRRAHAENDAVAVSIFVNPTQFGPSEDISRYPRDMERDMAMLRKERVDMLFTTTPEEMYPPGFDTWVEVKDVTDRLEGEVRPGHFRGVATVVCKLFNIVRPARAYFGQKDAQQCVVVRKMARELDMDLDVVVVPTVREPDGLAMSSRNVYLAEVSERQAALCLYNALSLAQSMYAQGERDAASIRRAMTELVQREPLARLDYVSVAHPDTLAELERVEGAALASLAVRIGDRVRLIDNALLGPAQTRRREGGRKPSRKLSTFQINDIGARFVVAELTARGLVAVPTSRRTAGADVVVREPDGSAEAYLKVKASLKSPRLWPITPAERCLKGPGTYYVFLRRPSGRDTFEAFLTTGDEVARAVAETPKGGQRPGGKPFMHWALPADEDAAKALRERWKTWRPGKA